MTAPQLEQLFGSVVAAGDISNSYGVQNYEATRAIFICTQPRQPLWQEWPALKTLD